MNFTQAKAIRNKILETVKTKLIEIGYLTDDGSMKICSTISTVRISLEPHIYEFIASFEVNCDYTIYVHIVTDSLYSEFLQCDLHISTDGYYDPFQIDDTFTIITN